MASDLQGNTQTVAEIAGVPSGLGWTPDERLLVVTARSRKLYQLDDGESTEVADLSDLVQAPFNHLVVD